MRSRTTRALVVAGAAAGTIALGLSAATATTPTFHVSAGTAKAGTSIAITAKTLSNTTVVLTVYNAARTAKTGAASTCTSSSATGSLKIGKAVPGPKIATVPGNSAKFNNCTATGGFAVQATGTGTWYLNAQKYHKASNTVTGTLSAVHATVALTGGCSFPVSGFVPVSYSNKTGVLKMLGGTGAQAHLLVGSVTNPTGCFNLIQKGDYAAYAGSYKVAAKNTAYKPIHITQ